MDETTKWVIGISITVILFIAGFVGRIIYQGQKDREKQEDQKLKIHFDELYEEIMANMRDVNISEIYGLIVKYSGGVPLYHPDFVGIELPEMKETLEAHLPKESKIYGNIIHQILRNNERYKELRLKIKKDIESVNISMVSPNSPANKSPAIFDTVFWPLFSWWGDRSQRKSNPVPNFEEIGTSSDFGPKRLVISGWSSGAIAYAETEDDENICKSIIGKIANNLDYQNEAATIIQSTGRILADFRNFKAALFETFNSTKKFWPGTSTYKFKKENKKCLKCKGIFS